MRSRSSAPAAQIWFLFRRRRRWWLLLTQQSRRGANGVEVRLSSASTGGRCRSRGTTARIVVHFAHVTTDLAGHPIFLVQTVGLADARSDLFPVPLPEVVGRRSGRLCVRKGDGAGVLLKVRHGLEGGLFLRPCGTLAGRRWLRRRRALVCRRLANAKLGKPGLEFVHRGRGSRRRGDGRAGPRARVGGPRRWEHWFATTAADSEPGHGQPCRAESVHRALV